MMSDEIRITLTTIMVEEVIALPAHKGIYEHWCRHTDCKRWGSFGYERGFGTAWFWSGHKGDGESGR